MIGNVKIPRADYPEVLRRRLAGEETSTIARTYGCTRPAIDRVLKLQGYVAPSRRRKNFTDEEKAQIVRLYTQEFKSHEAIAPIIGCSRQAVLAVLKRMRVRIRRPGRRMAAPAPVPPPPPPGAALPELVIERRHVVTRMVPEPPKALLMAGRGGSGRMPISLKGFPPLLGKAE